MTPRSLIRSVCTFSSGKKQKTREEHIAHHQWHHIRQHLTLYIDLHNQVGESWIQKWKGCAKIRLSKRSLRTRFDLRLTIEPEVLLGLVKHHWGVLIRVNPLCSVKLTAKKRLKIGFAKKESHLPTINSQVLCWFQGGYIYPKIIHWLVRLFRCEQSKPAGLSSKFHSLIMKAQTIHDIKYLLNLPIRINHIISCRFFQKEKLGTLGRVPEIYTNIYHLYMDSIMVVSANMA